MPVGKGSTSKAAFKIESGDYGTAIAVNGGSEENQIHLLSENLSPSVKHSSSVFLDGSSGARSLFQILKQYAGDLGIEGHYDGILPLMICTLGMSDQDNSPADRGSGAYEHCIEPSSDLSTRDFTIYEEIAASNVARRRGTLCVEKDVSIWENVSCMINGFGLEISPDSVKFNFNVVPKSQDRDTGTNSASSNWDVPQSTQMKFEDCVLYLKPRDQFTISASTDDVVVNESGNVTITLSTGTYTGIQLAEELSSKLNPGGGVLSGEYSVEYHEETRRFKIFTTNGVSFSIVGASASFNAKDKLGFTATTSSGTSHQSNVMAGVDDYAAFVDADKVGFSKFSMNYSNNLDVESQDSLSGLYIVEPERNDLRNIGGSVELPRYRNDNFFQAVDGSTTYIGRIVLTGALIGGSNYEEFVINLTSIKFDTMSAPASGPAIIKQNLNFKMSSPSFLDFVNLFNSDFFFKNLTGSSLSADPTSFGRYVDGLYIGDSNILKRIDKDTPPATMDTLTSGDVIHAIKQFGSELYIGTANGKVYEYSNGGSASLSCDFGSGDVQAFVEYDGSLFAAEDTTGRFYSFNGTSWSLSCDTLLTDVVDMIKFNGSIFALGDDGIDSFVYSYNGTTWALVNSISSTTLDGEGNMIIHGDKLYVAANDTIRVYDGTDFDTEIYNAGSNTIAWMTSYKGEIIIAEKGASHLIKVLNPHTGNTSTLYTGGTSTFSDECHPQFYDGHLIIGGGGNNIHLLKNIHEMYITMQNRTSTNPL